MVSYGSFLALGLFGNQNGNETFVTKEERTAAERHSLFILCPEIWTVSERSALHPPPFTAPYCKLMSFGTTTLCRTTSDSYFYAENLKIIDVNIHYSCSDVLDKPLSRAWIQALYRLCFVIFNYCEMNLKYFSEIRLVEIAGNASAIILPYSYHVAWLNRQYFHVIVSYRSLPTVRQINLCSPSLLHKLFKTSQQ